MSTQRVAPDDVLAIFATDLALQPFIETATLIVTERLVGHYTEARLTEIERWLTAHLASTSGGGGSSTGVGQVSEIRADEITVRYATDAASGEGLDSSRFGRHVRMLDYKNLLSSTVARFSVH